MQHVILQHENNYFSNQCLFFKVPNVSLFTTHAMFRILRYDGDINHINFNNQSNLNILFIISMMFPVKNIIPIKWMAMNRREKHFMTNCTKTQIVSTCLPFSHYRHFMSLHPYCINPTIGILWEEFSNT